MFINLNKQINTERGGENVIAMGNFLDVYGLNSKNNKNNETVNKAVRESKNDFGSFMNRANDEVKQNKSVQPNKDVQQSKPIQQNKSVQQKEQVKVQNQKTDDSTKTDEMKNTDVKETKKESVLQKAKGEKNEDKSTKTEKDEQDEALIEDVAQKLGIDTNELMKLLQTLNINVDTLKSVSQDTSKLATEIEKLVDFISEKVDGVKDLKKDIPFSQKIEAIVKNADKVLEKLEKFSDVKTDENVNTIDIQNEEKTLQNVDDTNQNTKQENNNETEKALNSEVQNVKVKASVKSDVSKADEKDILADGVGAEKEIKAQAKEANADNSKSEPSLLSKIKFVEFKKDNSIKTQTIENVFPIEQKEVSFNKVETLQKAVQTANIKNSEIFDQVMDNAKLVLSKNQTEMELNLKPESLGKLSLKIATENGLVMAKITAENQQVKQIIESNLIHLKEALEQQGLNVQQFSVSVGDDSKKELL
jgi:flagellar hook-length control protein FliK